MKKRFSTVVCLTAAVMTLVFAGRESGRFGRISSPPPSPEVNKSIPTRASAEEGVLPTVNGVVIASDEWQSIRYNGGDQWGLYQVADNEFSLLNLSSYYRMNGGGVLIDDRYEFLYYYTGTWGGANYYIFDPYKNKKISHNAFAMLDWTAVATDVTYDENTDEVYGCFHTADTEGFFFGTRDRTEGTSRKIADLVTGLVAIAANRSGELFGITMDSHLVKLDKKTGAVTEIGATGIDINPEVQHSAEFDPASGMLIWSATAADNSTGLYSVDTSTGKAVLRYSFPHNERMVGIYTERTRNMDVPLAPAIGEVTFEGTSLKGKCMITAPSKTRGGAELQGKVTIKLYVNNILAQTIQDQDPGTDIQVDLTVPETGFNKIAASASNDLGESYKERKKIFAGPDIPAAVTDLRLTNDNGTATLSWTAPSAGKNNGTLDVDNISYTVTRKVDGESKVVAEDLKSTTFSEQLDFTAPTLVRYSVKACSGNDAGEESETNAVLFGPSVFPVPFDAAFSSKDVFSLFKIDNANNDGEYNTWQWSKTYDAACCIKTYSTNDDWLITPDLDLKGGFTYELSFTAFAWGGTEYLNVWYGQGHRGSDLKNQLLKTVTLSNSPDNRQDFHILFTPEADGVYNIGFHDVSTPYQANYLYISEIHVSAGASPDAPAMISDLAVKAAENGKTEATLTFTAPWSTYGGKPLKELDGVRISLGGKEIKQLTPATGEEVSLTVEAGQGFNEYEVSAFNRHGSSIAKAKVYAGIDTPLPPSDVRLAADMAASRLSLGWTAPSKGVNDAFINVDDLLYDIAVLDDNLDPGEVLASGIKDTQYSIENFDFGGDQNLVTLAVKAFNEIGASEYVPSNFILKGDPYALPFRESISNGLDNDFWGVSNPEYGSWTTRAGRTGNDYAFMFEPLSWTLYGNGAVNDLFVDDATLFSGMLDMRGSNNSMLAFETYIDPTNCANFRKNWNIEERLEIMVSPEGDPNRLVPIDTIAFADYNEAGWYHFQYDLSKYKECERLIVGFYGAGVNAKVYVDDISVKDVFDNDLAVRKVKCSPTMTVGHKESVKVTLENEGASGFKNYGLELYAGDLLVAGKETEDTIAPGESREISFDVTPTNDWSDIVELKAMLTSGDENERNNSITSEIRINRVALPAPKNLQLELGDDGSAIFHWDGVSADMSVPQPIREGFESYSDYLIAGVGEWTLVDVDGAKTFGINNNGSMLGYRNAGRAMAFIVFNPVALKLEGNEFQPFDGNKYMAAFSAQTVNSDDWLISPRLSGDKQTVAFMASAFTEEFGDEPFEVLYTTSEDPSDLEKYVRVGEYGAGSTQWQRIEADLPEGALYFAIRYMADKKFSLKIDDVEYMSVAVPVEGLSDILGYRLYMDGLPVGQEIIGGIEYVLSGDECTGRNFYVTAVTNLGESAPSNTVSFCPVGINDIEVSKNVAARYFTVDGMEMPSPVKGVNIIVTSDGKVSKVIVK